MAKEKVTATLDAARFAATREMAGARGVSAGVDSAVASYVGRRRHLAAVDHWLAEMQRDHGPIPGPTLEWAARIVDAWAAPPARRRRMR